MNAISHETSHFGCIRKHPKSVWDCIKFPCLTCFYLHLISQHCLLFPLTWSDYFAMSTMITAYLCPSIKTVFVLILGNTVKKFLLLGLILLAVFESSRAFLDSSRVVKLKSWSQFWAIRGCLPLLKPVCSDQLLWTSCFTEFSRTALIFIIWGYLASVLHSTELKNKKGKCGFFWLVRWSFSWLDLLVSVIHYNC